MWMTQVHGCWQIMGTVENKRVAIKIENKQNRE